MNEQMGTLRPVKQRLHDQGTTDNGGDVVEPVGDITASVRFADADDQAGGFQLLDQVTLPFGDDADGFALYDQAGTLIEWWNITASPGYAITLPPLTFKQRQAITQAESTAAAVT